MKRTAILFAIFTICSFVSFSQLKVDQYGRIGIGTNFPNPGYQCHIKGDLLLSNYPSYPSYDLRLKVGNGAPGTEIQSSADRIAFWASYVGYHQLDADKFNKMSDSTVKFNVQAIHSPLDKIMAVKAHQYNFKSNYISETGDSLTRYIPQYGFISQEIRRALPDVEITTPGKENVLLMDYDMIIPLLTAGMQEQQKIIQQLQSTTAILMATNQNYSSEPTDGLPESSRLIGSTPNPFSSSTTLECKLIQDYQTAEIKVFDMQGITRKSFTVQPSAGNKSVQLNSSDLPLKGKYVYSLFVNGSIIDAKIVIFE